MKLNQLDFNKVKSLTGANVHQITDRGETGLYLAVSYHIRKPDTKDASCIHALYHAGVDINAVTHNGYTALQLAAVFGHTPLVCWLLSKNARNIGYPDAYMLARSQGKFISPSKTQIRPFQIRNYIT